MSVLHRVVRPVFPFVLTGLLVLVADLPVVEAQSPIDFFLHGTGPDNNPPTLFLNITEPTGATAKFRDSASVNFSGGNPWKAIGTWPAASPLTTGTLTALSDLHVWLGLKNSDDQGTQFDLRAEVLKNGAVVATGLTRCITGIVRNANQAKAVTVAFGSVPATLFNGTTDQLAITLSTRIGTNPDDTKCPGHNNAVGLRLYFDATTRPARFDATIGAGANPVPILSALAPTSVPAGSAATPLTATGQQFVPASIVKFNATALPTTFVSATSLTATIPATLLSTKGTVAVTVENPAPGGGISTPLPFTIENRAPVLAPIGNQTVLLGSTLFLTVAATDPDNDPVTFAVTPLPLPSHATFNSQTGLFTFTPDATQVGTFPLTMVVTDGVVTASESITLTVTGAPPGGVTSVSGRVDDTSQHPLDQLTVSLKGTALSTTTAADGTFTLTAATMPTGRQQLVVTGLPQNFANLVAPVDLIPNVSNQLAQPLTLPPIDTATAVTVTPAATTVLTSPTLNVTVTIPPHTAKNADGTDYTDQLTISPVPEYGRPESRPVELKPGLAVTIQPAGITLSPPVPITFPNPEHLAPGNELDLWSLSPDTGTFYVAGRLRVSADGATLDTISGGVQKTAWHFPLPPAAQIPNDQNRIIGGCTTCPLASSGDLTEGTLTQDLIIPGVRTLGVTRDLTLRYTSTTADVRPILPVTLTLPAIAAVPQTFSADLTVGGLQQGSRGYWDASVMNETATSTTRVGIQYDAAPLPTGRYPYELTLFSNYGLAGNSGIGAVSRGFTMLRNEQQSPFGAGWTLSGLDRLLLSPAGDLAILAKGNGQTLPFVSVSGANLVSWWPAEGNAHDLKSGNNGTLQGGVAFAAGALGQGFLFDGVNDVVTVADTANQKPAVFTISGWINLAQVPAAGTEYFLMSKYNGNFSGWILRIGEQLIPVLTVTRPPNLQAFVVPSTAPIPVNTWVHLAGTYDGTTASLYVNGVLGGSQPLAGGYTPATVPMAIGAASWFAGGFTTGRIDEVELYARVLSAAEIHALFTAGGRRNLTDDFLPPPSEYSALKRNLDGTATRRLKDGTVSQFNAQGLQTSMADRNGNTTTYAYDGQGRLASLTDPAGQVTTLSYSGSRLATITDPAGRVTQFQHDTAGNLIRITDPASLVTAFAYDPQHRLTQRTDARQKTYTYQFDYAGRLQRATLPDGAFREVRPTELTAVPNLAAGQGTPANPAPLSQPPVIQATFTDAKGQTTTFETDAIGRVTKQIDSLNRTTTITRDPQGNPLMITRPNGAVTTLTYDAKGNLLTSTEQSIVATTSFLYEPTFNQVTRITDPKGNQTNITYDAKGNPLTITDADNKVTTFTYDSRGLLLTSKDALNQTTTFTYDALGRLLTTTDPLNRTTTLTYDNAGNVATSTDALNRVTSFQYDQKNRLKQVTDPLSGVTQYTYDGNGNLLTVTDAKNQTTTFAYDDRNRLTNTTDPLGKVEAYEYDGNDNLTKRITPKLDHITFAYDAVNQLLSKTLPGSLVTSYQYDPVGNVTNVTDPDSVLAMTYDLANRLLTTNTAGSSNQPNVTLTYTYDKNGNRLTLNGGTASHTYVYDVLNRLTSLTTPAGAATFAYDALSRRTSLTLPNGTQSSYTYDVASQVTNILHQITASSTQINKADYLYNGVGNRTSLTDRRGAQTFGYDNLDRLTNATHPLPPTSQTFAYDAVGNRTTGGSVVNAGNQLTATTTHSYEYDDNGNVTKKTLLATGNFTVYSYDVENRLTKVEDFAAGNPTPTATSTYRYDGLGRRIEKVANGQTRRYVYDGEDILLEYDGSNALQARYTHGPGIDEPIAVTRGSSTYYYHADMLGSVSELTDSIGTVAKAYAYDAYGNIVEQTGTVENPYTYTGREFDAETGFYYYRARAYDPRPGRFVQTDPVGHAGWDTNLYTYVDNDPTNQTDPFGLYGFAGAAGAATTSAFLQLIANLDQTGGDLGRSLRCVNLTNVAVSGLLGIVGPTLGQQLIRGIPGPFNIPRYAEALIYFGTVAPLGTITKVAVPDYALGDLLRTLPLPEQLLGSKCECQGLSWGNLVTKIIQ